MNLMLTQGNALRIPLADESVHCVVTSPPYYMLRDYGVIGQIGCERTPDEFINNLAVVFREIYRVCRSDGAVWLNIADSMAGSTADRAAKLYGESKTKLLQEWGYRDKEELDIPHRLRQALRQVGFYGRITNIWSKPNPMPESVTDRPTKAHEYLFLLTKSPKYYYDCDAIREPIAKATITRNLYPHHGSKNAEGAYSISRDREPGEFGDEARGRNRRTVWHIATAPYSGAHFATYPPALVEPCIKAGTSERGVCPECGSPWERVVEKAAKLEAHRNVLGIGPKTVSGGGDGTTLHHDITVTTLSWQPTCECWKAMPDPDAPRTKNARKRYQQDAGGYWKFRAVCRFGITKKATVFDPFAGSGTTLQVARALGRNGIGLDLSLEYLHLARKRLSLDALDAWGKAKKDGAVVTDLPMFGGQDE